MEFFQKLTKFLPKRFQPKRDPEDPQKDIKKNAPKEKEAIKTAFALYCASKHGTKDNKLCPKCNALLSIVFQKMRTCRYGAAKPNCEQCDIKCFGEPYMDRFMEIMDATRKKMYLRHPMMAGRQKIFRMGVEYAQRQRNETESKKEDRKRQERIAKTRANQAKRKLQQKAKPSGTDKK